MSSAGIHYDSRGPHTGSGASSVCSQSMSVPSCLRIFPSAVPLLPARPTFSVTFLTGLWPQQPLGGPPREYKAPICCLGIHTPGFTPVQREPTHSA